MSTPNFALDNPIIDKRLRDYSKIPVYKHRDVMPVSRVISDITMPTVEHKTVATKAEPVTEANLPPKPITHVRSQDVSKTDTAKLKTKHSKKTIALLAMAGLIFIIGIAIALFQLKTNNQVAAQVKQISNHAANANFGGSAPPDETKPSNLGSYVVPPDQPRYLKISTLNVNARVRRLGVTAQNQLQAPNNIYDAGWYEDSSKPGDAAGAILIDGHVHGPTQPGVFAGLKNLKPGDVIQLVRGDNKIFNFKVVKTQSYDVNKVDMVAALTSVIPGKLGLNLMTCTGQIKGNEYNQRLIVFAVAE